jgi:hypothetical protein
MLNGRHVQKQGHLKSTWLSIRTVVQEEGCLRSTWLIVEMDAQ